MIETLHNEQNFVFAFIEWNIVDENTWMCDDGEYVKIGYCWIHPLYQKIGVLPKLIEMIFEDERTRNCLYVFYRKDKNDNITQKPIHKFLRFTKYHRIIREGHDGQGKDNHYSNTASTSNS